MNIIVVDDEPLALRGIARLVREAGEAGEVQEFSLPRTALAFAREHRVDVAFLDIEMPGMSGIELALIDSDSYRFLEGDPVAVNSYRGDYLPAYSWAEYSIGPFLRMG